MTKPDTILPVSVRANFLNVLVYGIPGIGKTFLAGTSPRCLILECGTGETDTSATAGHSVEVWPIHSWAELTEAHEYLRHEGHDDFDWVWIDSVTGLENRLMMERMQLIGGTTTGSGKTRSQLVPDRPDYLHVQSVISNFSQYFVDLPMNFGMTAHVMIEDTRSFDEEGDETIEPMLLPMIQGGRGKLSQKVSSMMGLVGYMDTLTVTEGGPEIRALLTEGDGRHLARSRYGHLGNKKGWVITPTIPKLVAEISEHKKARAAKKATKVAKKAVKAVKATKASKAAGLRTR